MHLDLTRAPHASRKQWLTTIAKYDAPLGLRDKAPKGRHKLTLAERPGKSGTREVRQKAWETQPEGPENQPEKRRDPRTSPAGLSRLQQTDVNALSDH